MGGRDVVRIIIPMARYTSHFEPLLPIISFPCPRSSSVSMLKPIKKISKFIKFNIKNIHLRLKRRINRVWALSWCTCNSGGGAHIAHKQL